MSKIKRVRELCDRLWAETEQIADPKDPVRITYRHVISQFREVLGEGGMNLRVSTAEANTAPRVTPGMHRRAERPESDIRIIGSPLAKPFALCITGCGREATEPGDTCEVCAR